MPRNSSGTYSLYTPGNPVVPSTVITTTWANNTLSDLATAMTDSLSRSGDGGMLAPLELAAGAIGAPGLSWTAEPTAGLYRASAGNFRYAIGGADVTTWTSAGFAVTGTLSSSGAATLNSLGVTGNATVGGTLGVTGNTSITAGLLMGSATGGNQGAGTVNAVGVYDDGVLLANQTGANPTGTVGLAAVNGSAGTFMRSDAAPALSQAIAPTWTGQHAWDLALHGPVGSAAAPAFTFSGDLDTGIYRSGSGQIDFSADGTQVARFYSGGLQMLGANTVVFAQDGTAGAPGFSFQNDPDTGIYRRSTNQLAFSAGNTLVGFFEPALLYLRVPGAGPDGAASGPTWSFENDPDTGIYSVGANSLGMATGGSNRVTVGPGVQVGAPTGGDQGAGTVNAAAVYDDGLQIYPNIPRSTTTTTIAASDLGKCIAVSANIAIPASVFSAGDTISVYNDSASAVSITIAAGTLRLGGTTTTGTRTLAARGIATLWFNVGGGTPEVICTGNVT